MSEPNIAAVNLREARYDTLFLGELPYEPMPEEAYVGIAGLCRVTNTSRKRSDALNEHLDKLPGIIDNILLNHDIAARQDQAAIFGFIKPETRQDVSTIVSDIFKKWEITHDRQGLGTLVDSAYTPARWLVIETAAAVVQVVGENSHNFKLSNKTDGDLAVGNINDPLKALDKIKANLRVLSDTSAIAKRLGWSEAEVEEVFTPGIRKYLAVHNINDPLKALDKIKANLETLSDIPAIAKRLGWREAEVEKVLTLSTRKHLAVHNINDPLKGLVDLVNRNKLIH